MAKLVGGSYDGINCFVTPHQRTLYIPVPYSIESEASLNIDGVVKWKRSEDRYEKQADGRFHYTNTVHYKPEET